MAEQNDRSGYEVGDITRFINGTRVTRRQVLKGAAAIGALSALGPLASACGGDETTTEPSASAAGTPNKGGDLMVGIVGGSAKDTADPHTGSFEPDIAIQYIMYEGLTAWDFDLNLQNQLAESIEPNADGTVWQVKLRDGVMWHDGTPVTADDVVFSLD
ncbi:MAG TPA: ABC transporter substrate-binding protein, partial [Thermoleophilia bacterium]|nr:ABC transporter substrate-binding protein [Thermoleophilia bacterium]